MVLYERCYRVWYAVERIIRYLHTLSVSRSSKSCSSVDPDVAIADSKADMNARNFEAL